LEVATIGWDAAEALVAIAAGALAGSVSLTGFGLDSAIEVLAASLVLARLRTFLGGGAPDEGRERRTLRVVAATFFALALYLVVDGAFALATGARPATSPAGIAVTAAALVVMPALALAKRRTGRRLGGPGGRPEAGRLLVAEASESLVCASLSAATLLALVLNASLGWTWVDPAAGFVIAAFALREGREAWGGELCCD
jgi:divalent metal cation (Fe/Co/Zn/Cd) transporter